MSKVFIVGSSGNCAYAHMFRDNGWDVVDTLEESSLVCFTGGADVSPEMYGEPKHKASVCQPSRDLEEVGVWCKAMYQEIPMVGVCRGGQFLNVMSGGRMFQHVDKHAISGKHSVVDQDTGEEISVTSTHHQMMRPHESGYVMASAYGLSTKREDGYGGVNEGDQEDAEVVFYPHTMSLCFQPHPEHQNADECRTYFFNLIKELFYNGPTAEAA